jgi:hypothetical protein
MSVTDPYGRIYAYAGEEIIIENRLTEQQHAGCYEAVGIPVPPYDPDREYVSIEPSSGGDAERLRRYLREQRLEHHSELRVTYEPDSPRAGEIDGLIARLAEAPVFPGELEERAHTGPADTSVEVAVEVLYERVGPHQASRQIEAAQHHEAEARELIALAEQLALDEDALDEAVLNSDTDEPSAINSDGRGAQIRHLFLVEGAAATRRLIEQAAQ